MKEKDMKRMVYFNNMEDEGESTYPIYFEEDQVKGENTKRLNRMVNFTKNDIEEHKENILKLIKKGGVGAANSYIDKNNLWQIENSWIINNKDINKNHLENICTKLNRDEYLDSSISNNLSIEKQNKSIQDISVPKEIIKSESDKTLVTECNPILRRAVLFNVKYSTGKVEFYYDETGTYAIEIFQDDNKKVIRICNFIVKPISILTIDDGINSSQYYKIECIINTSESKEVVFSMRDIKSKEVFLEKLNIKYAFSQETKAFEFWKLYIAKVMETVPEEVVYSHIGWRLIDNKWVYLHGYGAIGSNDRNLRGLKGKGISFDLGITPRQALNSSLAMLNISEDRSKTVPLFLYSHLSLLKTLFLQAKVQPNLLLWIYGRTNSMKTSVAKVFFNIFNEEKIAASFKDTKAGLEPKVFEYKDCVLILDDYHPSTSSNEKRAMEDTAQYITRLYGDNISKSRATKDLRKAKEFPPRGLCAVTGEDIITGESTLSRIIGIEVCSTTYNGKILSYYQNNPLIYSTHIYCFLQWVSDNANSLIQFINKRHIELRNEINNQSILKRYVETYIINLIIIEIVLEYCKACGENYDFVNMKNEWSLIIMNTLEEQQKIALEENPVYMYCYAINSLISNGKCSLIKLGSNNKIESNFIGYYDEEFFYLDTDLAIGAVEKFWRDQSKSCLFGKKAMNKALEEAKVIKVEYEKNGDRYRVRRTLKLDNTNLRYLHIYRVQFEKILNI